MSNSIIHGAIAASVVFAACGDPGVRPRDDAGTDAVDARDGAPRDATASDTSSPPLPVIDATSCEQADVQAAIDRATAGTVVQIPAGTCVWGANNSAVNVNRGIVLQGAGRNMTVIDIAPTAGQWGNAVVQITAAATVRSMTIRTPTSGNSGTAFAGSANGFRVSDVQYLVGTTTTNGYFLYAGAYGLVDNCDVTGGAGDNELIFARGPTDSWQTAGSMGGADNLIIEDTVFRGSGYVNDCNSNSRCVVRFCTIEGAMKIDGHGKATNTPPRGVRQMEAYENEWTSTANYWAAIELRGGTGRVFHNRAASPSAWLRLVEYGALYATSNFGNRIQTAADYPIDDQIGVGRDPKVGASEPMYLWGNRVAGMPWQIAWGDATFAPTLQQVIAADRDYFIEASTFDGTSGVGTGTAVQMRAIHPTRAGVGFWVTDEGDWDTRTPAHDGVLYVWTGTDWRLDYTPYTYPHPLRSTRGR